MKAAIDIGSNSIQLLVVDDSGDTALDICAMVGLGSGLRDSGLLGRDSMEAASDAINQFVNLALESGVASPAHIRSVGTSALRRALNSTTFLHGIEERTGLKTRVISGMEEARLTAIGALDDLSLPPGPLVLVDPGGGSTELITIQHDPESHLPPMLLHAVSLELGTVRLTEERLRQVHTPPRSIAGAHRHVDEIFSSITSTQRPKAVVAVAGTATALAAAQLELREFSGESVHGVVLGAATLHKWIDLLRHRTTVQRRQLLRASPDRATTALAGTIILAQVLKWAHHPTLVVSNRGLRHALVKNQIHRPASFSPPVHT